MKCKVLTAVICGAIMLASTLCFAAVDGGKIALGGISPGMSETDLLNTFGQPNHRSGDDWTYPNFKVEVERGIVKEISTTSQAIATPGGVRVGQGAEALNTTFGRADKVDSDYNDTEYTYLSTDGIKKIEFKVVNGVIAKITCELRD